MNKNIKTKTRTSYVSGSNALLLQGNYGTYKNQRVEAKVQTTKKKAPAHSKINQQKEQSSHIAKARTNKLSNVNTAKTNKSFAIALMFAMIAILAVVILLLKTQFAVTEASDEVIKIQRELVHIKNSNELLATEINQSIDMNEVYAIATSELGMIQPTKDHIRYIETSQSSYTAQYDAINVPIDETEVTIGNVLGFIK